MTSIPKPLKFINPHYKKIVKFFKALKGQPFFKQNLADFIAVLSMTMAEEGSKDCLFYLLQGTKQDLKSWGFQFIHYLCGDISQEYQDRMKQGKKDFADLIELTNKILPDMIKNHSEEQALDLLMEVDQLEKIKPHVTQDNIQRITLYLISCSQYCADQYELKKCLQITYDIFLKMRRFVSAMRIAIKMNNLELMNRCLNTCKDRTLKKQMALDIARQRVNISFPEDDELEELSSNKLLKDFYQKLIEDLDIKEAKHPDHVYKIALDGGDGVKIDSKKANIAHSIVNSLVNAGMGTDALMLGQDSKETH